MADDLMQRLTAVARAVEFDDFDTNNCDVIREGIVEIQRLRACLKYEEHRFATQSTHSEGCYTLGPRHYECALQEIELLRRQLENVRDQNRRIIVEAERIRNENVALRERIEKAPDGEVYEYDWDGRANHSFIVDAPASYEGHRVRLVLEEG